MDNIAWWGIPASVLLIGLVEVVKGWGFNPKYAGVLALGLGAVLGGLSFLFADSSLAAAIAQGAQVGLVASGLWSTVKNARE